MQRKDKQWSAGNILEDAIQCQKNLTSLYNSAANEASAERIRKDFLNILMEEHLLHRDVFTVMQRRGLYAPLVAEGSEIAQAQQSYGQKQI